MIENQDLLSQNTNLRIMLGISKEQIQLWEKKMEEIGDKVNES